jgi:hypothetical protein
MQKLGISREEYENQQCNKEHENDRKAPPSHREQCADRLLQGLCVDCRPFVGRNVAAGHKWAGREVGLQLWVGHDMKGGENSI